MRPRLGGGVLRLATGAPAGGQRGAGRGHAMVLSSVGMMSGRAASMFLGFLFWLLAARLFPPAKVGLTAGVVSAMMLCTQLGQFGVGSAFINLFPRHQQRSAWLLDTATSMVALTSVLAGGLFLSLASVASREFRVVAASRFYATLFLAMCVLGTVNVLLDQISMALGRGVQVLTRNVLFGVISVVLLAVLWLRVRDASSSAMFSLWVVAGVSACSLGALQLWRSLGRYSYRPRLERRLAGQLVRVGLPNYALTLTERAPGLILPLVVTELLSPADNAYWYTVWMMAWVVYIIPVSMGIGVFAEVSHRPGSLSTAIRSGVRWALWLGTGAAACLALSANLVLGMLGQRYASYGVTPLRILVLGLFPLTFVQVYFAICRATERLSEAILTGLVSGLLAVTAAVLVARPYGLGGMAWAWVASQCLAVTWALFRIRAIRRSIPDTSPGSLVGSEESPAGVAPASA